MRIKYIILDVDGTLTDSGIYYDNIGNELKKFSTKDGTGIKCGLEAGMIFIVLTGRECAATTRRLAELGVENVYQGVDDKTAWLRKWMDTEEIDKSLVAYIGDDINDLEPMRLCGYIGCPSDADKEIRKVADYVSDVNGGHGAVRDVIEHILREESIWEDIVKRVYGTGV